MTTLDDLPEEFPVLPGDQIMVDLEEDGVLITRVKFVVDRRHQEQFEDDAGGIRIYFEVPDTRTRMALWFDAPEILKHWPQEEVL